MGRLFTVLVGVVVTVLLAMSLGRSATLTGYTITPVSCENVEGLSNQPVPGLPQWIAGQVVSGSASHTSYAPVTYVGGSPVIGSCVLIDPPGATWSRATGISHLDDVVGFYMDGSGPAHGFIRNFSSGNFTSFNISSLRTVPGGMNVAGHVVGSVGTSDHGFAATTTLGSGGTYTISSSVLIDFTGVSGASNTVISGVNPGLGGTLGGQAVVVGYYTANRHTHGFWGTLNFASGVTGATLYSFDCAGASDTQPRGINDAGMIVGNMTAGKDTGGFIATWGSGAPLTACSGPYLSNSRGPNSGLSFHGVNNNGQIAAFGTGLLTPTSP